MQRGIAANQPQIGPGVIDSIADGLSLALARPLLLLVPMLLDLYYWLGWRFSIEALTSPMRTWVLEQDQSNNAEIASRLESAGRSDITRILSFLVPSLLGRAGREGVYFMRERPSVVPQQWWIDTLLLVAFVLGATLLLIIYSVPLADAAVDRSRSISAVVRAMGRAWLRSLGLHALALGIALLLLGPITIGWAALLLVGVDASPLIGLASLAIGLFGFLVWSFAVNAIVVSDVGPLKAIYYGFAVVRTYFWPTVGLVSASMLITVGLGEVWREIAGTPPALLIGVIANAFFASGIAMAGMVFYESRITSLKPVLTR
jgi:hypothetical protein